MVRLTLILIVVLSFSAFNSGNKTLAASYRVGIAPSLPEPFADIEVIEPETLEDKIKRGLKVKDPNSVEISPSLPNNTSPLPTKHEAWKRVLAQLSKKSGIELTLAPEKTQLAFELGLAKGAYDFAYITPLQFNAFKDYPGYKAMVKRKAQPLRGMVFTRKIGPHSSLTQLRGETFAFPGALDFAGSVAVRASLQRLSVDFTPHFLPDAATTYAEVAKGNFVAGGGTLETLKAQPPEIQGALRVIWDSPGYSPYPFVAHPRVPFFTIIKLQRAMVNLIKDPNAKSMLKHIFVANGFEVARDSDWDEINLIELDRLNKNAPKSNRPILSPPTIQLP